MVPNLVPAKDLPNAFSLNSIAFNTGAVIGPVLSGVVIATLGQGYTYLFNAVSFLAVIVALLCHRRHSAGSEESQRGQPGRHERRHPLHLFAQDHPFHHDDGLSSPPSSASANTMMPIVARDILHVGEVGYGLLVSAQSIGSVTAGLVISQMPGHPQTGPDLPERGDRLWAGDRGFRLLEQLPAGHADPDLIGAADTVSTIIRNTIRQLQTPDHIRGRMTSINQIFFQGGPQLGEVEAGLVAQFFGVPFAIISGGIGCILAVGLIARRFPEIVKYDRYEAPPKA